MENSDRFLDAFGTIERLLRTTTDEDRRTPFYRLVDHAARVNPVARRYQNDLKEFADLRNAIVHERTDEHVIAEPNDRAVREIMHILTLMQDPPRVIPLFQQEVFYMTVDDPVAVAAYAMVERDFSQVPVYEGERFAGLLTTDDIARWLGRCVCDNQPYVVETPLADVLACTADHENVVFFGREGTLFEALDAFQEAEKSGKRLEAVLITASGSPAEALLGIITVLDMPAIYEALGG